MPAPRIEPAIVLVRPSEQGNVGAAARAMANMGLSELVLVEPAAEIGSVARAFAVSAGDILDRARRCPSLAEALAPYGRIVATTSSRSRALKEAPIAPRELAARLAADPPGTRTALVFGPEASGLDNEELARASPLVRIPAAPRQPTLNLGQAVLILAYELHLARSGAESGARSGNGPGGRPGPAREGADEAPAPAAEIEALFSHLDRVLAEIGFARDDTAASVVRDLRRLAARAAPSRREVTILRGICRRALGELGRSIPSPETPAGR